MPWHFFVIACMLNAPADCQRVVLDIPREVVSEMYGTDKPTPPAFVSATACALALVSKINRYVPFKTMGSEWTAFGCTR